MCPTSLCPRRPQLPPAFPGGVTRPAGVSDPGSCHTVVSSLEFGLCEILCMFLKTGISASCSSLALSNMRPIHLCSVMSYSLRPYGLSLTGLLCLLGSPGKNTGMSCHFLLQGVFLTPWTVAQQALLSMGFSGQEYWNELPFPPPGEVLDPGIKLSPMSPALQMDSLPLSQGGFPIN